jgi:hypothetical protein
MKVLEVGSKDDHERRRGEEEEEEEKKARPRYNLIGMTT